MFYNKYIYHGEMYETYNKKYKPVYFFWWHSSQVHRHRSPTHTQHIYIYLYIKYTFLVFLFLYFMLSY